MSSSLQSKPPCFLCPNESKKSYRQPRCSFSVYRRRQNLISQWAVFSPSQSPEPWSTALHGLSLFIWVQNVLLTLGCCLSVSSFKLYSASSRVLSLSQPLKYENIKLYVFSNRRTSKLSLTSISSLSVSVLKSHTTNFYVFSAQKHQNMNIVQMFSLSPLQNLELTAQS